MVSATQLRLSAMPSLSMLGAALRGFGVRGWLAALVVASLSAVVTGIPSVMVENPWFVRMTPTRPQDYVFWILSSVLVGLIAGTYAASRLESSEKPVIAGGVLATLAIGCPICNKLVVLLIGTSGALTFFAPAQFFIGAGSVLLLAWTLLLRARTVVSPACPLPAQPA